MKTRYLTSLILLTFLLGCSATRGPSTHNQMQIKMAQLERKVQSRDQEISDLKYEIDGLKGRIGNTSSRDDSYDSSEPVEEFDYDSYKDGDEKVSSKNEGDTRIIRVSASARQVQTALKNAGYYNGTVDGKFGRRSKSAVSDFQKDHELTVDGIVGLRTWTELKSYLD